MTQVRPVAASPRAERLEALSWMDRWVDPTLLFLAATSVPILIIQTGTPTAGDEDLIIASAWVIWAAFTLNLVVRLALSPDRRAELRRSAPDLILVIGQPLWTIGDRKAGAGIAFIRLLVALIRMLRRGRLLRRTGQKLRTEPMRILAFVVPFVWLTSAALLYRFELDDETVTSYWDALWWSAVTMATVGYGDIFPVSLEGRVVAIATMIVGIGMFSVITAKLAEVLFVQRNTANRRELLVQDHTLIVGWSPKVFTLIEELVLANASEESALVVVLGTEDSFVMQDMIEAEVQSLRHATTRVVTRTGDPRSLPDLARCHPETARSVIVVTDDESDAAVVRALLALQAVAPDADTPVIAELDDPATAEAIRRGLGPRFTLIDPTTFLARTAAQACQSPGIAAAYDTLLQFAGAEIYVLEVPDVVGRTFAEAQWCFPDVCLIGVHRDGTARLNPPGDLVIDTGDRLVLLAEDDSAVHVDLDAVAAAPPPPVPSPAPSTRPRSVLVLGWSRIGPLVVTELTAYLPPGSRITVAYDPELAGAAGPVPPGTGDIAVVTRAAHGHAYSSLLDELGTDTVDQAMVLCYRQGISPDEADARALTTTLHLRSHLRATGRDATILTELLDERDAALAEAATAGDFILSDRLVSLLLAQLSETPMLATVFDDLLDPAGSELYAKHATRYVGADQPTTFAALVAAAQARGEIAVGFRHGDRGQTTINPPKAMPVTLGSGDQVLVFAADAT